MFYDLFLPEDLAMVALSLILPENLPPYLDSRLSMDELMTGVSFASAGSRFNPLTAKLDGTISMPKQMENFKEYKTKVEAVIGTERTEALIEKTVYVISAGTNNFVVNYYGASGIRRYSYSIPGYSQFLVQQIQQFIESIVQCVQLDGSMIMKARDATITRFTEDLDCELESRRGCT
ncbi:GDSL esterase/lipase At5g45960-like isoform X1 [Apium graveolens]|uniref:GDSL esterase/lipase At5g45960-like isoform X1 n=2 Tax=Apium graveolens TaxID=4045 RepID=UPI003D7B68F4